MKTAQLSGATTTVRFNVSPLLLYLDFSVCRLARLERPSLVKVAPLGVVQYCNRVFVKSFAFPEVSV